MTFALTPARPATRAAKGLVLTVCCLVVILPFLAVVSTSLADERQVAAAGGYVLWPERPSLYAYEAIFEGGVVTRALLVLSMSTLGFFISGSRTRKLDT